MGKTVFIGHIFDESFLSVLNTYKDRITKHDLIFLTAPQTRSVLLKKLNSIAPQVKIVPVPNIGRDMYPFLTILKSINLQSDDLIMKWHDKKRNHINGQILSFKERLNLLEYCLPTDADKSSRFLEILKNQPRTNLVTFSSWLMPVGLRMGSNREKLFEFSMRENLPWEDINNDSYFPAGGIFAVRGAAFFNSQFLKTDGDTIEHGHGGLDGTWAHAAERWVGILANRDGDVVGIN